MERQALREAVIRYNAEGPEGLHDRPRSGRLEGLSEGQQAALKAWVLRGPDPEREGVSAWRLVDICAHAERLRRALQRVGPVAPAQAAGALASESATAASAEQRSRAGRV